jgi:hypothetical protein
MHMELLMSVCSHVSAAEAMDFNEFGMDIMPLKEPE